MKRYLCTASRGLTLGAGLAVLWLILGSHALFFTACAAVLYSVVLPVVMMRSIDTAGVSVLVRRQLVMMGKPDMVSVSLTGTGARSPLRYDVSLYLPPYLVKKHERHAPSGLMVFFEANRRGDYQVGDSVVTIRDPLRVFSLSRALSSPPRVTVFPRQTASLIVWLAVVVASVAAVAIVLMVVFVLSRAAFETRFGFLRTITDSQERRRVAACIRRMASLDEALLVANPREAIIALLYMGVAALQDLPLSLARGETPEELVIRARERSEPVASSLELLVSAFYRARYSDQDVHQPQQAIASRGIRTGVFSPPSRPQLRASGPPICAPSHPSRQFDAGRPSQNRFFGSVKPLSRIFTMLDALSCHRRMVLCLLRVRQSEVSGAEWVKTISSTWGRYACNM